VATQTALRRFLVLSCHSRSARSQLSIRSLTASTRSLSDRISSRPVCMRFCSDSMRLCWSSNCPNASSWASISATSSPASVLKLRFSCPECSASSFRAATVLWSALSFSRNE
jgi:hypothetical protein